MKFETQLFGGEPSGAGSAQTYQSRCVDVRDDRASANHEWASLDHETVEVVERAELRVDRAVVGDVVAPIGVGRRHDRAQPNRVDAEPIQVIEMLRYACEIADTVTVRVRERPDVDVVHDSVAPPHGLGRRGRANGTFRSVAHRRDRLDDQIELVSRKRNLGRTCARDGPRASGFSGTGRAAPAAVKHQTVHRVRYGVEGRPDRGKIAPGLECSLFSERDLENYTPGSFHPPPFRGTPLDGRRREYVAVGALPAGRRKLRIKHLYRDFVSAHPRILTLLILTAEPGAWALFGSRRRSAI
jgi:hypothetical protein